MRPELQIFLLFMAVPIQYLISKWMTPNLADREYLTRRILTDTLHIWKNLRTLWKNQPDECVAKEVMLYTEPSGYFSGSPEPRNNRGNIKYRIGQVIRHKRFGYRGVIIGWDLQTKAPDYWIQVNHLDPTWRHQPNYSVLVDTRDRDDVQTTYVVEENIEIITEIEVQHPEVEEYFKGFDGLQYTPRPFLKILYPKD